MEIGVIVSLLRVVICCIVYAFFVCIPLRERFRYSVAKTIVLFASLIVITAVVTILFFLHNTFLSEYSTVGIVIWILSAFVIFGIAVRGSYLEVVFIVLVVLNLYVNMASIAKIITNSIECPGTSVVVYNLIIMAVLIAYIPLLYILMYRSLKRVVELNTSSSFWKYIWMIPTLTYLVFYIKFTSDYWKAPIDAGKKDIMFGVLWSFTTYIFFWVTLQMLYHVHQGISTKERMNNISSQLRMQEEQYKRLIEDMEHTTRIRHDWRHHLLSLNSFAEVGDMEKMKSYLKVLMPEYEAQSIVPFCDNHVVTMILQYYAAVAKDQGVQLKTRMVIPEQIGILDTDLCIIFGNLVENAVEACQIRHMKEKSIEVTAEMRGMQLVTVVKNTYHSTIVHKEGIYQSTKHEGAGVGLSSVKKVTEKYKGIMKVEYDHQHFKVSILLNIR